LAAKVIIVKGHKDLLLVTAKKIYTFAAPLKSAVEVP